MCSKKSTIQLSRLIAGPVKRNGAMGTSSLNGNLNGKPLSDALANGGHPSMSLLIRRTFKSPNTLHHKKGNNIPFYAAIQRVIRWLFPAMLFMAYYNFEAPDAFLPGLFGFKQFRDQIEDEKDESVRKRKKVKRLVDNDLSLSG